jgi:ParB family chromosome partitioning protein
MREMLQEKSGGVTQITKIPIASITTNPYQPRKTFLAEQLEELASSIREYGVIQPITVRKNFIGGYELISGERRLRAAVFAGLKTVPCILVNASDRECSLMCLIENIQRTDLNFFEEADGIKRLMNEFSLSQTEVAEKIGMAQSTLSNKLRLLKLTDAQRKTVISAKLTERHARALIRLPEDRRDEVLNRVVATDMSVVDTEQAVDMILAEAVVKKKPLRAYKIGDIRIFSNSLNKMIETMRKSGVDAKSRKSETEEYIEYTVIIPKSKDSKQKFTIL